MDDGIDYPVTYVEQDIGQVLRRTSRKPHSIALAYGHAANRTWTLVQKAESAGSAPGGGRPQLWKPLAARRDPTAQRLAVDLTQFKL